uniref:G-protein coupled receptors family 1 profile domain-containing protein n=1 Tax=Cyprinus carpio TaxID=7962 RepID=A0A8C2FFJ5_CYPCA
METAAPPIVTSDSNLYITTDELKPYASEPSKNYKEDYNQLIKAGTVYISIISSIEIPLICLAIYAVYSLIKLHHSAPVFVINLLASDLIQIVCMLLFTSPSMWTISLTTMMWTSYTGFYFMTCIAIERYVLIAHPVWHRSYRSVKCFVCTSLTGWLLPFILIIIFLLLLSFDIIPDFILIEILFYMPLIFYAVIIVCFVGSCRSLSHSISLTPVKKQLVLAPLFFVLMSYTFLILPINILLIVRNNNTSSLFRFTGVLYLLNPLVDCLLYVFMRSDAENIIRMPHCCSRLKRVETEMGQTTSTDVQRDHV